MESNQAEGKYFCSECGTALSDAAHFCPGCGAQLESAEPQADAVGLTGDGPSSVEPMRLRVAWAAYAGSAGLLTVLVALQWFLAAFHVYLVLGFVMTRFVLRRLVEFHPVHDTINNAYSMKVRMFFLWPLSMLTLLMRLSVNKVL